MEVVTKAWESVDWERVQARVETEVAALGERQDDSDARKERLVEQSNAYKDRTNKENRKLAVPLIKAFQNEFEGLLARSSAAESALIDICGSIINLPDPKSLLKSAEAWKSDAEKTQKAVEEREDLKRQVLKLNNELEDFRGKDVKVRKLKDKLAKLESEQDTFIENAVSEVEKKAEIELNSRLAELIAERDQMKEQNEMLEKSLDSLETKNKDIQRKLEFAKMSVEQKDGLENEQLAITMKDLADANHKIIFLEERISQLESEAEKVNESKKAGNIEDIAALGSVLIQKDEVIQQLTNDIKRAESSQSDELCKWKTLYLGLEKKNREMEADLNELKATLDSRNDYEAIRKELRLLREIQFGEAAEANAESIERLGETVESLDRLLAEQNRRLQNENASLRVMNDGFKGDEVMTAIVSGKHSSIVEVIGKKVGAEEVKKFDRKNSDLDIAYEIHKANQKKKFEADLKFEDPNIDVLTFLKNQKAKEARKDGNPGSSSSSSVTPMKQVTKLGTHTITTTALPPQSLLHRMSNGHSHSKNDLRMDEDLKLSSVLKRFSTSPLKPVEIKTSEEQKAELETIEKMQARIQANIKAINGQPLNTTEIASNCKRLMIAYNIGQRLFAKHVMNQVVKSQGSLSELLSKPRHWSKLTDKGREAFRRIYGWISDDEAITLLCSLSPRRVWPSDQNVEHPKPETLLDVSEPVVIKEELDIKPEIIPKTEPVVEFSEPVKIESPESSKSEACPSGAASGAANLRASRWRHDDISKEKILSILQTELKKIEEETTTSDKNGASKPNSTHNRRASASDTAPVPKPRATAVELLLKKRMAMGLQPLTQAQYDKYTTLDTELLVKQIKEFLSNNSISQRQFGEHILGLSQGSVSDLLARPKSWIQLTQKGREPFIRMKLFLDEMTESIEEDDKQPKITVCDEDSDLAKTLASILSSVQKDPTNERLYDCIKLEPKSEIDLMMEKQGASSPSDLIKYIDPSGEEVLDTLEIVYRVKNVLEKYGISPRVFGDEYLKCTPAMCADLMIRTKSYENAKPNEKILFTLMRDFLNDPSVIPNLVRIEEGSDSVKEKLESLFRAEVPPRPLKRKASSDFEDYDPNKKPIQRTVITDYQKDTLRFVFVNELHPSNELCEQIATKLDMSLRTVQNWFHNHRTRSKAREKEGKVYSDALPNGNTMKSDSWRDELQKMLDEAPAITLQWAPEYVPRCVSVKSSKSVESPNNNNDTPMFTFDKPVSAPNVAVKKNSSGGQLDKVVARMRQLAEGRVAAASNSA